jgi:hypothetical protein
VVADWVEPNLSYWRASRASRKIGRCAGDHLNHHWVHGRLPSTCTASPHCLIDRDARVIGCNLPVGNGPLLEQAPAMAQILREFAAGASVEQLPGRAAQVLEWIDTGRDREPGGEGRCAN